MFFTPSMIILLPAILLTMYAQGKVKSNFSQYLRVMTKQGYTGAQVARFILDEHGLQDITIEISKGQLSDHYDPRNRVVRLSTEVYQSSSIASVSVAAHEVGHAIQHANGYLPLSLRSIVFPVARFGSSAAWLFIMLGLMMPALGDLMDLGILLFGAAVFFQVITLPVEFNASSRALQLLDSNGFITEEEVSGAKSVLNAAALTYVAAMATGIAQLLRLIIIRNSSRR